MRRDPSWWRASLIWSALALIAAAVPALYLAASPVYTPAGTAAGWSTLRAYLLRGALALAPAAPLLLRHRRRGYRAALAATAVLLAAIVVLGAFSIGPLFAPAACFALFALGAEALARRAGQRRHEADGRAAVRGLRPLLLECARGLLRALAGQRDSVGV